MAFGPRPSLAPPVGALAPQTPMRALAESGDFGLPDCLTPGVVAIRKPHYVLPKSRPSRFLPPGDNRRNLLPDRLETETEIKEEIFVQQSSTDEDPRCLEEPQYGSDALIF